MNLLQLQYFLLVAETSHLSQSAEMLGISQPSLSIMIKKLEQELGVALFEHSGRNIKLTECGITYAKYIKEVFNALKSGEQALLDIQKKQKLVINLACTCPRFTYSIIKQIFPQMPNITIKQSIIKDKNIPAFLASHTNSYAISSPHCFDNEKIYCQQIFEEPLLLAISKKNNLAKLSSVKLENLKNENFIALTEGSTLRTICEDLCLQAGFQPNNIMECDHMSRAEAISNNYGIAISTSLAASVEYVMPSTIKFIPISNHNCSRKIAIFKHKNKYYSQFALEFEERVLSAAKYLSGVADITYKKLCIESGIIPSVQCSL